MLHISESVLAREAYQMVSRLVLQASGTMRQYIKFNLGDISRKMHRNISDHVCCDINDEAWKDALYLAVVFKVLEWSTKDSWDHFSFFPVLYLLYNRFVPFTFSPTWLLFRFCQKLFQTIFEHAPEFCQRYIFKIMFCCCKHARWNRIKKLLFIQFSAGSSIFLHISTCSYTCHC